LTTAGVTLRTTGAKVSCTSFMLRGTLPVGSGCKVDCGSDMPS
jgi:hypothetical protein